MVRSAPIRFLPLIVALLSWAQRDDVERHVKADPALLASTITWAKVDPVLLKRVVGGGIKDQYRFIVVLHDQA